MHQWGTEVEYTHIQDAYYAAKNLAHPPHIGLTEADRKEIKAYHAALDNFIACLKKQLKAPKSEEKHNIEDCPDGFNCPHQ